MGLFGNDQEQDARLDAIEEWLQGLTGVVQQHKLDTVELKLELMKLKAQVGEKPSEQDFDPAIMKISAGLAEARELAKQAAGAAEEGWENMQKSALDALDKLNAELDEVENRSSG